MHQRHPTKLLTIPFSLQVATLGEIDAGTVVNPSDDLDDTRHNLRQQMDFTTE